MADPKTEDLTTGQHDLAEIERERARQATEGADERTHERRAERADYLAAKLEERAESEQRADREDRG
jgi:hypothetical protein